jgi:uncharacterized membrane protein YkvA (DUF1232 family)
MSDPPRVADVLNDIPVEYRDRYNYLLQQPTMPVKELRAYVKKYLATVQQVGIMVKLLDMEQAEQLANTALALLDHMKPEHPPTVKLLIQAAVSYFVFEEQDEEITGVLGFDDDLQVFNAVSRALGRSDLVLRAKRRD